ncbi:MAG TPA: sensor histidine kinase KdpD, partial [Pyrinomonadaceae bacterium]|nr:sensor histidine kinase KdpD [Pyrinomonadaceae bacterium]
MPMDHNGNRKSPESLLAKLQEGEQAGLRVYIGAAAGVGKTYQMLEDAHQLKQQGVDIVVAVVETHGREETGSMIGDLECVPLRRIEYRNVTLEEMDVEAVIQRRPAIAIVDELAHSNVPGSKNRKRYEDVLDLLSAGISVITAINIQHLESLNDAVARTTG